MKDIADKIILLRLASRRACRCESTEKSTITLKTKVLFLIERGAGTKDIINGLAIAKTNLALLTSQMVTEGLIYKTVKEDDKREKFYTLTEKGKEYLLDRKNAINKIWEEKLDSESSLADAEQKIDAVLELMSFIK